MSTITLLTDFGTADEYVGLMKGVILSICPSVSIVDITHQIDPQDIVQAAYTIKSSYRYFPRGTVHLIVVDPGVGSERDILALHAKRHFFLAPDNGILTLLLKEGKFDSIFRVDNSNLFLKSISPTFHGRDIFAPVAAHLAGGIELNQLGTKIDLKEVLRLGGLDSWISENGELVGKIISIDRFGNLMTNIDSKRLLKYCKTGPNNKLKIKIGRGTIDGLSDTYGNADPQSPLALIGSRGYLEIAVNQSSANRYFKVKKGDPIRVAF